MKVTHTNCVAIRTTYLRATAARFPRIRVQAMGVDKPVLEVKYDEALTETDNHENAVYEYVRHLGWNWHNVSASKAHEGYVFTKGVE